MRSLLSSILVLALLGALSQPVVSQAQGMPPEARKAIHALFHNHDKIERTVVQTDHGYTSTTESTDPEVAAALKKHIKQMETRLKSGRMVRRWDPAFPEFVRYYDQMEYKMTETPNGVRMEVRGKTPEAIKVARNHAAVVSDFVERGWAAHDTRHPTALGATPNSEELQTDPKAGCDGNCAGCAAGEGCRVSPSDAAPASHGLTVGPGSAPDAHSKHASETACPQCKAGVANQTPGCCNVSENNPSIRQ